MDGARMRAEEPILGRAWHGINQQKTKQQKKSQLGLIIQRQRQRQRQNGKFSYWAYSEYLQLFKGKTYSFWQKIFDF